MLCATAPLMAGKPASSTGVLAVRSEPCEHTVTKSIQECIHLVNAPAVMTLPHAIPRQDVCTVKATFYGPCPVRQVHVCVCCCCSQVSNGNCDQGFKPLTRLPCNQVPCAVSDPGLTLGFTAWGECGVQCGSGFSQRTAYCINPYGALADLSMCSNYSGECGHQPPACKANILQLLGWHDNRVTLYSFWPV